MSEPVQAAPGLDELKRVARLQQVATRAGDDGQHERDRSARGWRGTVVEPLAHLLAEHVHVRANVVAKTDKGEPARIQHDAHA
jgi:hypothetical protein